MGILRRLLANDMTRLFSANIWVNVVFFMTFVVLGFVLDNIEFGAFRVAQAYIAIATSIAMLGLNTAVTHQFPRLSGPEQQTALPAILTLVIGSSTIAGILLYYLVPTTNRDTGITLQWFYAISFPMIIAGATICNIALSVYQARGALKEYSRFQIIWKSLLFISALLGAVFMNAKAVLIAMALIYPALILFPRFRDRVKRFRFEATELKPLYLRFFHSAIWPFASACVSMIYANLEFLSIDEADLNSGLAGAYSLASLIFIGGTAFFLPFQTYAGSRVVNNRITMAGLFWLQGFCLCAVFVVALVAYGMAHLLAHLDPVKFGPDFLGFTLLVCLKLTIWGSYAVIGSVLNYLDKGFESFMLTLIVLSSILLAFLTFDISTLRNVVIVQIASSIFILLGCAYLVVAGYRKR